MNYKYENFSFVEVKESFEAHKHDDNYEATETIVLPVGLHGAIVSMTKSSSDGFLTHYDIAFTLEDKEISVGVLEANMEKYFILG